jgi:cold-inducible RNA-binding protein
MNAKLYVGNLPFTVTDSQLTTHFSQAGRVASVNLIMDRETGRPRGFGFVEMMSDDEAQEAITQFHGKPFEGRDLTVNIAKPKENSRSGGGGGYRPQGQDRRPYREGGQDRERRRESSRY